MKVIKGPVFRVINSITLKNDRINYRNTGFFTTFDHALGIASASSGCYLLVAETSAIQDIEFCPKCCLVYGQSFLKCAKCTWEGS